MKDVVHRIIRDCRLKEPRAGRKVMTIITSGAILAGKAILVDSECWENGKTGVALGVLSETPASFARAHGIRKPRVRSSAGP